MHKNLKTVHFSIRWLSFAVNSWFHLCILSIFKSVLWEQEYIMFFGKQKKKHQKKNCSYSCYQVQFGFALQISTEFA